MPRRTAATEKRSLIEAINVTSAITAYRAAIRARKRRAFVTTYALTMAISTMLTANARAIDIKIVDDPGGKAVTILLTGQIVDGDALRVRGSIGSIDASKSIIVQLGFAGGRTAEALSIGRLLHQTQIRTTVPARARCLSPCPLVLVGGCDPVTEKPSCIKYSSAALGFTSFKLDMPESNYTVADLDNTVSNVQRTILWVADYLRDVGADLNMLKYYLSAQRPNEAKYITNEQALDLGIAVISEQTGQLIEPKKRRR